MITEILIPGWEVLESHLGSARRSIFISSPWITKNGLDVVLSVLEKRTRDSLDFIRIWSRLSPLDDLLGMSDSLSLLEFLEFCKSHFSLQPEISVNDHLHAKFYLIDNQKVLLGSSNLTGGGFDSNVEILCLLDDEKCILQVKDIINRYQASMLPVSREALGSYCDRVISLKERYAKGRITIEDIKKQTFNGH